MRDIRDERDSRFEAAQIEDDGILRIIGHDQGTGVSEIFGPDIMSYEWVYIVAPEKVGALLKILGGRDGDDVLALLAAYYHHTVCMARIGACWSKPGAVGETSRCPAWKLSAGAVRLTRKALLNSDDGYC